jgi:Flp pilus assembly protein TadB
MKTKQFIFILFLFLIAPQMPLHANEPIASVYYESPPVERGKKEKRLKELQKKAKKRTFQRRQNEYRRNIIHTKKDGLRKIGTLLKATGWPTFGAFLLLGLIFMALVPVPLGAVVLFFILSFHGLIAAITGIILYRKWRRINKKAYRKEKKKEREQKEAIKKVNPKKQKKKAAVLLTLGIILLLGAGAGLTVLLTASLGSLLTALFLFLPILVFVGGLIFLLFGIAMFCRINKRKGK